MGTRWSEDLGPLKMCISKKYQDNVHLTHFLYRPSTSLLPSAFRYFLCIKFSGHIGKCLQNSTCSFHPLFHWSNVGAIQKVLIILLCQYFELASCCLERYVTRSKPRIYIISTRTHHFSSMQPQQTAVRFSRKRYRLVCSYQFRHKSMMNEARHTLIPGHSG